jgi:hypothetical protein
VSVLRRVALVVLVASAGGLLVGLPAASASSVFGGSFGEEGSGAGQFSAPVAVAVDEAGEGDVYVVDKGNGRVQWFGATGEFKGQFDGKATPAKSFASPEAIAIDNSSSPSKGDVYVEDTGHGVIDKFTSEGGYLGQIATGAGGAAFGELVGVSVNKVGEVWVFQRSKEVDNYTAEANTFIESREDAFGNAFEGQASFAVDSEDNFYVSKNGKFIGKDTSGGAPLLEEFGPAEQALGAAVDLSADNVYVSFPKFAAVFTKQGTTLEEFGSGHLAAAQGLAVNATNKNVYVADESADKVAIFARVSETPLIEAQSAEAIGRSTAMLTGTVNPRGETPTTCVFQYDLDKASLAGSPSLAECAPPAAELGSGKTGVAVTAKLEALAPNTIYYYRLTASNNTGPAEGTVQEFLTLPDPPTVQTEEASGLTPYTALLNATVNPGASGHTAQDDTTYQFQYSTDETFSSQTPVTDAGEGTNPVPVHAQLEGLQPGTTYHYRVLATNDNNQTPQTTTGQPKTFATVPTPPVLSGTTAGQITASSAQIVATLQPQGLPTRWELQLGTSPGALEHQAAGNTSSPEGEVLTLQLENLQPGVTYYYRLTAQNPDGEAPPAEGRLTTSPPSTNLGSLASTGFPLLFVPPNIFPGQTPTTPPPTVRKLTNAQKLAKALNACHKLRSKSKRKACQKQAHEKYGPAKRSKKRH